MPTKDLEHISFAPGPLFMRILNCCTFHAIIEKQTKTASRGKITWTIWQAPILYKIEAIKKN